MTTLGNATHARTPSGFKVAPQSYEKLEAAADALRPLLPTVPGPGGRPVICGWRVLEQTLRRAGYEPHVVDKSELEDCAAFTTSEPKLVVMRRDVYDGLFTGQVFSRSTVIHETCHIALNHHVTLHRGAVLGQHEIFYDSEWQAKAMTAAVMMPIEACKAAQNAADLAWMCGTSVESAGYRLKRLIEKGIIPPKANMSLW